MRIVGGSLRGRRLVEPDGSAIRPTTDRARETLFNILTHRHALTGARVLDVFAGTGALGCEALSRGAQKAVFIENDARSLRIIHANITALKLGDRATPLKRSALLPGVAPERFDLVFLDPPYGKGLGEQAVVALHKQNWLADQALLVLEEQPSSLPERINGFHRIDHRTIGQTAFGFFRRNHDSVAS